MKTNKSKTIWDYIPVARCLLFWPLIVAGGRLVVRVMLNLWDMIEP